MRSFLTPLIVGAVLVLSLVSALDAVDGKDGRTSPVRAEVTPAGQTSGETPTAGSPAVEPPRIEKQEAIERRLRREGVSGALVFTDERCRLSVLALPSLDWLRQSDGSASCTFSLSPDGRHYFAGERVAFSPRGDLAATCGGNRTGVVTTAGRPRYDIEGFCTPAWKPDGTLTAVDGQGIFALPAGCAARPGPCGAPILTEGALLAALRAVASRRPSTESVPVEIRDPEVEEVAWLSDSRLVLAMSFAYAGGQEALVAVFDNGRLASRPTIAGGLHDLRLSPGRRYFVIRGRAPRGLLFFDRDGRLLARDPVAGGHHAAWSPDERWIAVAGGGSTYLVRTEELAVLGRAEPSRLIRLPVFAADVAWR